jgi:hypothetical protein
MAKDELLLQSVPPNIKVHHVKAFQKSWTSKFGLGSIALRSLLFYRSKVNRMLKSHHFDLVYFSTTQFPVCILGAYWKRRFGIPYVIDMQDPWHSDYYQDKPKHQRPKKYWLSYRMNKYLEPRAMRTVDGLISVSEDYIDDLKERYPVIKNIPGETITFGAFEPDFDIAERNKTLFDPILDPAFINIVYIGRGGLDMHKAVGLLFKSFKDAMAKDTDLGRIKFWFIGTSYAPNGHGVPTIEPLAKEYGLGNQVTEITDRISYYHTLLTLQQADALFVPGSDDPKYTASKIYPYLLAKKPLLAIFNKESSAISILKEYHAEYVLSFDAPNANRVIQSFLEKVLGKELTAVEYDEKALQKYSAQNMARRQCDLFNKVTDGKS